MPIRYNGKSHDYDGDVYIGSDPVFIRPRRGIPITYWRHWYRSAVSNTASIDLSIAVRHRPKAEDRVYLAFVSTNNVLTVMSSPVMPYAIGMTWQTEAIIAGVAKCSLAFDGSFRKIVISDNVVFDTDMLPWLFYLTTSGEVKGGILGGAYASIVSSNVVSMDATRGPSGYLGYEDQGLMFFYVTDDGSLFYLQYIDGAWAGVVSVGDAPPDLVNVVANRTFDWRIALQLVDNTGTMFELFSMPYYSGWVGAEHLTLAAKITRFDVIEIFYPDLMSKERLTAQAVFKEILVLWGVETYIVHAENISYTDEDLEIENDYGYKVEITFDHVISGVGEDADCFLMADEEDTIFIGLAAEQINDNTAVIKFDNFNNAIGDLRLYYTDPTSKGEAGQAVPNSEITFMPTNLVPFATAAPAPVAIWNIGMQKILIEFDKPIIQIVQQTGFDVSGFEPYQSPGGPLVPTDYVVDSVTQEDVPVFYTANLSEGDHDDTQSLDKKVVLSKTETVNPAVTKTLLNIGTSATNTSNWGTFRTNYQKNKVQYIVYANELEAIGITKGSLIAALDLKVSAQPGRDLANVRIRVKETTDTTITAWHTTGFSAVLHHSASIARAGLTANTVHSFAFISPYEYSGDNLIIEICRDDASTSSGGGIYIRSGVGSNRLRGGYRDSGGTYPHDDMSNASNNAYILETTFSSQEYEYEEHGIYTANPYELLNDIDLRLIWTSAEPTDTEIVCYYAIDVEEPVSITWLPISNGDVIEIDAADVGKFVHVKTELSTEDTSVTPVLHDLHIEQAYPDSHRVQLNLTYNGRLKYPQGNTQIDFDGLLYGQNNTAVEPFTMSFKSVIDPPFFNPGEHDYITIKAPSITVDVNEVVYNDLKHSDDSYVTAAVGMMVTVIHVGELPL